ncbi:MAG: caspase domain-containing protein, partial [Rhodospirillales bacterium]
YRLNEGGGGWSDQQTWTIAVKVVGTELLTVKGFNYATFVIEERARSSGGMAFVRRKWYEPGSGVVIKSAKTWTGKFKVGGAKTSYLDINDEEVFEIAAVDFPEGTTTHALKGTKAVAVDPSLMAELQKLKQTVQEVKSTSQVAGEASPVAVEGIAFGSYHALVIGIDKYKYLPKLTTAVRDAKAVAQVLADEYNFKVNLLINPTRLNIIDALDEFRESLGGEDNLLIYYAGHGWLDEDADRGYWLPADARSNRRARWVSNATITDTLKTLQAKHVMIVADSCYSGTLTRSANIGLRSGDYFKRMAKKWARVALVSGGLEPVADQGTGGHSPFAKAFIEILQENDTVIDGTQLFGKLRRPVMVSARQTPEYSDVRNSGHDGGDFLFVRKK